MKKSIFAALALLTLAAGYGCSSQAEETAPEDSEDKLGLVRGPVDHAAVVEISTMMLVKPSLAPPLDSALDPFNESDPFHISAGKFQDTFKTNLAKFDATDEKTDWTDEQITTWTSRIAAGNYIVVDTSKPCDFNDPHTYLEIERAQLTGKAHQTCGGRMPNEDALDVTVNFLIRGPGASATDDDAITDGVDQATAKSTAKFPYLAEMNGL